jgi:hypothetical protein
MFLVKRIHLVEPHTTTVSDLPYDLWFKKSIFLLIFSLKKSIFPPIFSLASYFFFKKKLGYYKLRLDPSI